MSKHSIAVNVHHLTRIEGHGNIVVKVEKGALKEARWDVVETPRFFEVMLKDKHFTTAPILAARICGICSISHCLCSLEATEAAFDLTIPSRARDLRMLAKHAETLQSHFLHVFFLAAPDFLGLPSVIPLLEAKPEIVTLAARLKGLANRLSDLVAGRTTHPVTLTAGGLTTQPDRARLLPFRDELKRSLEDLDATVHLVRSLEIPSFARETEFVSLASEEEYPFIGRNLVSTDGGARSIADYLSVTNESVNEHNTSKWTRWHRDSYAVGALARFNNGYELLHSEAQRIARELGLEPVCHNPFMNTVAQVVECVHCSHESIALIDRITGKRDDEISTPVVPRAGSGVGAVEAPRGLLLHDYSYDGEGRITRANCVVPTTQNNANIHLDLADLVTVLVEGGANDQEAERLCSMLVRAYDPCLSCSVH